MNDKFQVGHVGWSPDYDSNKPRKQHVNIEDQTLEYAEALNDIADILQLPTGVTSAEIVSAINIWRDEAEKQFRDLYEVCNQFGGGASISHPRITRQLSAARKFLKNSQDQ
jgi:hypothetical protein